MEKPVTFLPTRSGFGQECVEKMHKGCLLLKQETNGLHLRWLVLDQDSKYIYWLNPKKDVMLIDHDNAIPLSSIKSVVVSQDALVLKDKETASQMVAVSALSFSFSIKAENQNIDIFSPTQSDFETWIGGLRHLLGKDKVLQAPIEAGQRLRSVNEPAFLLTRLSELVELTESLLKEGAILMEIRAKREREILNLNAQVADNVNLAKNMEDLLLNVKEDLSGKIDAKAQVVEELKSLLKEQEDVCGQLEDENNQLIAELNECVDSLNKKDELIGLMQKKLQRRIELEGALAKGEEAEEEVEEGEEDEEEEDDDEDEEVDVAAAAQREVGKSGKSGDFSEEQYKSLMSECTHLMQQYQWLREMNERQDARNKENMQRLQEMKIGAELRRQMVAREMAERAQERERRRREEEEEEEEEDWRRRRKKKKKE
eukprot:MONOS_9364.1-p1 / transcript=MONOS_9364.1 / gene=MONOS_9364 / organism=Monocercomonoides_exilis_PA203 / gene_product=unspecified product / transcript_product=unspecified product / location=Mono_scaffold00384:17782-19344(-) / protein_length=428 / sequence_SO=supercontig / SO=protein_coding / is_pseudo=false